LGGEEAPERRDKKGNTLRRAAPVLLTIACLSAFPAARAEDIPDPLQLLERLIQPPAKAARKALRHVPVAPAEPAAQPEAAAPPDLLSVPMPRLRPEPSVPALGYAPAPGLDTAPLAARTQPPAASIPPILPLKAPPPAAGSTCGAMIARLGVEAKPLASMREGDCVVPAPVSVSALDGGAVTFTTEALLDCDMAEQVATWMDDTVQPIALKTLGARVSGLRIAASYACRNRDNLADAKLSEHARGNAIDISAFKVDGRWIEVETAWSAGGAPADFLSGSACGPFTTVLGPGSDSYHANHFHLDRAKRRTAGPSKGLYCK
jgi:hypothetical protein